MLPVVAKVNASPTPIQYELVNFVSLLLIVSTSSGKRRVLFVAMEAVEAFNEKNSQSQPLLADYSLFTLYTISL